MRLYRRRPETVEAVEYTGENADEVAELLGRPFRAGWLPEGTVVYRTGGNIRFLPADRFYASYEALLPVVAE